MTLLPRNRGARLACVIALILSSGNALPANAAPASELRIVDLDLAVDVDLDGEQFQVRAAIDLENGSDAPVGELDLFLTRLARVQQMTGTDAEPLPFRREYSALPFFDRFVVLPRFPLAPGARTRVSVQYRVRVPSGRGFGGQAWNMSLARGRGFLLETWFPTLVPVIDGSGFLAQTRRVPYRLRVRAPQGDRVISCGTRSTELADDQSEEVFAQDELASGSIPIVFGRYRRATRVLYGMPIEFYLSEVIADQVDERSLLELGNLIARTVRNNDRWFGVLPRDQVRVVLGDFGGVARGFPFLLLLPERFAQRELSVSERAVVCHEMSHTWFGNAVTGYGPGGNEWLNEGLATWISALHLEEIDGPEASGTLLRDWRRRLFESDLEPTPLVELRPYQNIVSREGYFKGALVFHELRKRLGRATLIGGLRAWFREYRGRACSVPEFEQAFSAAVGQDLQRFFDQWLRSTDLPEYQLVRWDSQPEGTEHRVSATLRNRGTGSGLVTVTLRGADDVAQTVLVSAEPGTEVTLVLRTAFRSERITLNESGTDLEGLRWRSLLTQAKSLRRDGDAEGAAQVLRGILESNPDISEVWYQLGRVHDQAANHGEALEAYQQAISHARDDEWTRPWSWVRRASILREFGDARQAEQELRSVLEEKQNPFGAQERARTLLGAR